MPSQALPDPSRILWKNQKTKRDHALALAESGFCLAPAEPDTKTHHITANDWRFTPTPPDIVSKLWPDTDDDSGDPNICIATGNGFFVLDFDKKAGGDESYKKLTTDDPTDVFDEKPKLPTTFTVKTQGGGYHVYLSAISEVRSQKDVLVPLGLPGCEVKGEIGHVVGPGSTISGRPYAVEISAPIAPAPGWVLELLATRRTAKLVEHTPLVELDTDENIRLATHWLETEAPAGEQGGRNNTAANIIAPTLKDYGISIGLALDLAREHWNAERCEPSMDDTELTTAIESGYRSATLRRPGHLVAQLPHHEFTPLPEEDIARITGPATKSPGLKPIDWNACTGEPPAIEWLWENLIPMHHVTTLFGDGGVGKTLFSQQLATIVATGGGDLCGHALRPGGVLGLFCEDDEAELWRRQHRINSATNTTMQSLQRFTAVSGFGRDNMLVTFDQHAPKPLPPLTHLRNACKTASPALIILDNISDTFGGDEVKKSHVNAFLKTYLGGIARDFGCAVLLLGHPSVAGLTTGSGISGSLMWSNSVRSRLFMRRVPEDDPNPDPNARVIELMKANYAPTGTWFRVRYENGLWAPVMGVAGSGAPASVEERREIVGRVLLRLIGQGENLSPNSRAGNCAARRLSREDEVSALRLTRDGLSRTISALLEAEEIHLETYRVDRSRDAQRYVAGPRPKQKAIADV